jgi:hypothetical protein
VCDEWNFCPELLTITPRSLVNSQMFDEKHASFQQSGIEAEQMKDLHGQMNCMKMKDTNCQMA